MSDSITLKVLTNAGLEIEDTAVSVRAPGVLGYLGILHNHAPLVTPLVPGKLTWRKADSTTREIQIDDGLLEISHNQLTVLVNSVTERS